jgi:predicted Zn-dependent peptidase
VLDEIVGLLRRQATRIDSVDLERARNQLAVRTLYGQEAPDSRLELAALDLFALGRVRSQEERLAAVAAVTARQVRATFARILAGPSGVGMAGKVPAGAADLAARLAVGRSG